MEKRRFFGKAVSEMGTFIRQIVTNEYFCLLLRFYVGGVFIYASMGKIANPALFSENVAAYNILPFWSINLVAIFIPWLELVCGLFLIIGLRTKTVASILVGMLVLFTAFVILNIKRQAPITCACFEGMGEPIGWPKVAHNLMWLVMTILVFFFDRIRIFRRG